MRWSCGWIHEFGRCLRLDCHKPGPCGGFNQDTGGKAARSQEDRMAEISQEEFERQVDRLTKAATDNGLIVEAGFLGFRKFFMSPNASSAEVTELRVVFFAGAQHLFASIVRMLDPGSDPTKADLRRMDSIERELDRFADELKAIARKKMS